MTKSPGKRESAGVASFDRRPKRQREDADPVVRYLGALQAEVMEIMWERGGATVREVVDQLNLTRRFAYTTILTLVSRLQARGLLVREREGRRFRYRPATSREEYLRQLSDDLIDRLFADFGEIGIARLGDRLEELDRTRRRKLGRARDGA